MRAKRRKLESVTGQTTRSWPVLILLLLLILVPTICVLWFMNEAVQNEHLAVREKLRDAYLGHLTLVRERLDDQWRQILFDSDRLAEDLPPAIVFEKCVRGGLADAAICYDVDRQRLYPDEATPPSGPASANAEWQEANRLEFLENDSAAAAEAYRTIANDWLDHQPAAFVEAARAWQAVARCYARAGRVADALEILTGVLSRDCYANATDLHGRLIVAEAELRALELMGDTHELEFMVLADRLQQRLLNYGNSKIAAAQRRFLMSRLGKLHSNAEFPTLAAEKLASKFIESQTTPATGPALAATDLANVWQIGSTSGRVLLLIHQATVVAKTRTILETQSLPPEVAVDILPPTAKYSAEDAFISLPTGNMLPGWRLTLALKNRDLFDNASHARVTAYFWTGTLGIGTIAALSLIIGRTISNQTRLARIKNDLVATITHELKTPLSSMRLLVDTLIHSEEFDQDQVRDYLGLIAKENERLSHLIDNFLTFSRIERNRYRFEFHPTDPKEIIDAAIDSVRERFQSPKCRLDLEIDANLPRVVTDANALVTVLLNLLDNAYKYSGEEKHIWLRAYAANGYVYFEVEDNGIGLSPREEKKIFKRFYQVNQHLSRSGGGCGLGLSIVQNIVKVHGGTVEVTSRQGRGSKFSVKLPVAPKEFSEAVETHQ